MRIAVLAVFWMAQFLWAFETLEDSKARFVFRDEIDGISPVSCSDGDFHLLPESAVYREGSGMPYRAYRVAVPSNAKPSVAVEDSVVSKFSREWCASDSLKSGRVEISAPILRDGVWVVDVLVPLLHVSGKTVNVRESFRVTVSFSGKPQNKRPGKRLLAQVLNPRGASSFGTSQNSGRALRKAAASELSGMTWISRLLVGDRDNGSTSEDGLYAVTFKQVYNSCREALRSSDCEGIPIDKIRLYGAPQDTMPDVIRSSRDILPNRLFEIPLDVRDHGPNSLSPDGTFDEGDTLFFVGYGTSMWKRIDLEDEKVSGSGMEYYYSSSPYSFFQYFQLGWNSNGKGARLSEISSPASGEEVPVLRYVRTERDALLRDTYFGYSGGWEESSGKEWFWLWNGPNDSLEVSSSTLFSAKSANLPGMVSGGASYLSVSYVPHSQTDLGASKFTFTVNGRVHSGYDRRLPGGNYEIAAPGLKSSGNSYSMKMLPNRITYDRFDGFTVAYEWNPSVENDTAEWILPGKRGGRLRIPFSANSDVQVVKFRDFEPIGVLPVKDGCLYDSLDASVDTRYLAVSKRNFRLPTVEPVPLRVSGTLSDISRISSKAEYLIIAPEAFGGPAVELAKFRSEGEAFASYNTAVVLAEDIYRHYSGGAADPVAIRNYLAYARSVSPNLSYALLAGNGHFDYRNLHSEYKTNWLPPFEKEDAVLEDFFAVLDSGERVLSDGYDLDLFVGRLPVGSVSDFKAYNEKVEEHERRATADNSDWRNTLVISADDAWTGYETDLIDHTTPAEDLSRSLQSSAEADGYHLDIRKIYLLDYTADASGQKPEAANDLINRINQGSLFTVYFGHGSITDWAYEGLMKPSYVSSLSNESRYTILGSFSCTVARFDKGNETSLSETFIQASRRGAIASVGATRETYGSYNRVFAKSVLTNALFPAGGTLGKAVALAKGMTSLNSGGQRRNNERYVLLGEPVVPMPNGALSVKLDRSVDTLRALDSVKLSGTVSGLSNGKIHVALLEQSYEKKLSQEPSDADSVAVLYDGSLIYSTEADVENGRFSVDFITPRKMAFGDTAAEIRLWASGSSTSDVGRALYSGISISGTSAYADSIIKNDTLPPSISIYSCLSPASGTSFSDGETVTLASPACLQVAIEDSTAIDFREEADEGISFEVVGEAASATPFHPWPYLEQTGKRAVVRMNFVESKYPAGLYRFKVSAMDIVGNASEKTVKVQITEGLSEGLSDVFTAPNPMKRKGTTFYFKDLAVGRSAEVTIFIYNQNGRLVYRIPGAVSGKTTWDGRDFYGRKLANGLYHYVVVSKVSASGGEKAKTFRKKQKLVISR